MREEDLLRLQHLLTSVVKFTTECRMFWQLMTLIVLKDERRTVRQDSIIDIARDELKQTIVNAMIMFYPNSPQKPNYIPCYVFQFECVNIASVAKPHFTYKTCCGVSINPFIHSSLQTEIDTFANIADPDETARNESSHQDEHCFPFCNFRPLFATMDVSNFCEGRIRVSNSGENGPVVVSYNINFIAGHIKSILYRTFVFSKAIIFFKLLDRPVLPKHR